MIKNCWTCKKEFESKDKRQKYCSIDCVYDKKSERNNILRKQKIGIKHSEEYKKKMSVRLKGKNTWLKGRKQTAEHIRKKSLAQKGMKHNWTGFKNPLEISKQRSLKASLSSNPNWQGGKSFEKYTEEWTDILRDAIRKRDNYMCQICGIKQENLQNKMHKKLSVHHINRNKKDTKKSNLISLCINCHAKQHKKI